MEDHMATTQKPNILLIMADQLIPQLTGAYGHPVVQTPHMNRLAEGGARFDAAYSPCPVCAPTRASMLTGRFVSNIGAYDNAAAYSCEEPTIPHYLTLSGYDTVLSGKLHAIGPDQLHGFSRRFTTNIYPADFAWVPVRGVEHPSERSHALNYVGEAVQVGRWSDCHSSDEEAHFRAIEYLRAKRIQKDATNPKPGSERPFFLHVSYHHPHEPFWPPQEYWDLYEDADIEIPSFPDNLDETYSTLDRWVNVYHGIRKAPQLRQPESLRRLRRAYYALVTYVDNRVGELLAALQETGFADDTLVIFSSDHGDMLGERGMVQKRTFYEFSSRVPLIIHFPDGRAAGMRLPAPVNMVDLLPTLLDLVEFPESERLPMDGSSLLPLINGDDQDDRVTFSEFHAQGSHATCFMVRQGRYKYVYIHGYDSQLFDLENDPGEWHNLAGQPDFAAIEAHLKALILSRFDPDAIEAQVSASVRRRWLIKRAMDISGVRWDAEPHFDPSLPMDEQYL
jgi:choline-sulfatase